MQAAVLKGYKDGYELIISDNADFDQALSELKDLFRKLQLDTVGEEKQIEDKENNKQFDQYQQP